MARNKSEDLNNHLFLQLEKISDEDLKGEELKAELERTEGIVSIADKILKNTGQALEAVKLQAKLEENGSQLKVPKLILEDKTSE